MKILGYGYPIHDFRFRHNDLPWNIRKFIHNKLNSVNFTMNLKTEEPWGTSAWSHTDLSRLGHGGVGGQVSLSLFLLRVPKNRKATPPMGDTSHGTASFTCEYEVLPASISCFVVVVVVCVCVALAHPRMARQGEVIPQEGSERRRKLNK